MPTSVELGVNIDHVASVRNARYRDDPAGGEPDPVRAAHEAELGGADGITIHLREDRRHITDRDLELLAQLYRVRLNLEMGATDEMVAIACRTARAHGRPHTAMLVPEGRDEVTTEGGLDVAGQLDRLKGVVEELRGAGLVTSAFIDADAEQVAAAADAGFDVCEVHTGPYAHAFGHAGGDMRKAELREALAAVRVAGEVIVGRGMRFNAGHALNYQNVEPIARLGGVGELHIGHAIVSRAVFTGLRAAVAEMKRLIVEA